MRDTVTKGSGTLGIFGDTRTEYSKSSQNALIEAPKNSVRLEQYQPTAAEAKARQLYGDTAAKYGYAQVKRDGALMSSGADWKDTRKMGINKNMTTKNLD